MPHSSASKVALVPLKRALSSLLCSTPIGLAIGVLFRNRVPHRGATIDTRGAGIQPSVKAALLWGFYESAETRFLQRHLDPKRDVVELGASIGAVSSHIARRLALGRQLVCVEANPGLLDSIRRNVRRNRPQTRLSVVHGAIFYPSNDTPPPASIHLEIGPTNTDSSIGGASEKSVEVPVVTLSEVLRSHSIEDYTLICDIEGAEVGFIEREKEALSRCQQLIIELHATSWQEKPLSVEDLREALEVEHGFVLRDQHGPVCVRAGALATHYLIAANKRSMSVDTLPTLLLKESIP